MSYIEYNKYTAACYCRLSRDDENDGTSVSIETQKKVLEDYCQTNGYDVYDFYCDDGFTGTNLGDVTYRYYRKPHNKAVLAQTGKIG